MRTAEGQKPAAEPLPDARVDASQHTLPFRTIDALADDYLKAAATGAPWERTAFALAAAVLESPHVRLALAVLANGPHAQARATELASAIVQQAVQTPIRREGTS